MFHLHQAARWVLLCAWPGWVSAQATAPLVNTAPQATASTPTNAEVVAPVLPGYQPMSQAPVADWRETNATVQRIGGWRSYAREAAASPAASDAPAPAPSSPHTRH